MKDFIISSTTYLLTLFLLFMNIEFAKSLVKPNTFFQEIVLMITVIAIFWGLNLIVPGVWVVLSGILLLITMAERTKTGWTFWWKIALIPTALTWMVIAVAAFTGKLAS